MTLEIIVLYILFFAVLFVLAYLLQLMFGIALLDKAMIVFIPLLLGLVYGAFKIGASYSSASEPKRMSELNIFKRQTKSIGLGVLGVVILLIILFLSSDVSSGLF